MIESSNIRFDEFVDKAMELKKLLGIELSTLSRYQDMLNNRILPAFGHWKVKDITGNHLSKFYKSLLQPGTNKKQSDKGLSQKTVLECHRLISSILEEARRQHIIAFNPAKDIKVSSSVPKTPNYYQPDEIEKIKKSFPKGKHKMANYWIFNAPIWWKTSRIYRVKIPIHRFQKSYSDYR